MDGSVGMQRSEPDRIEVSSDEVVNYLNHLESIEQEGPYGEAPDVLPAFPFEELIKVQAIFDYDQPAKGENFLHYEVIIYGEKDDNLDDPAILEFSGQMTSISPLEARKEIEDYIEIPF